MSVADLKERFEIFMTALRGVENVDLLTRDWPLPGRQKADYLAFDRLAIIEQKSLDSDPAHKVQAFVDKLIRERTIIGCGQVSLARILAGLPDGDSLRRELFQKLVKGVDDILAKADKQIAGTRRTFLNSEAVGIVVILNDNAQVLEPDFVVVKAFEMLRKVNSSGAIRYPNIHVVLLISEAHRVIGRQDSKLIPIETIYSDAGNACLRATQFAQILVRSWATFNHAGFVEWPDRTRDIVPRDPKKIFRLGHAEAPLA